MKNNNKEYWRDCWLQARKNVGGSSTEVVRLLGYNIYGRYRGHHNGSLRFRSAMEKGSKPKDPKRAALLEGLAGPHGPTLAKAIRIANADKPKEVRIRPHDEHVFAWRQHQAAKRYNEWHLLLRGAE